MWANLIVAGVCLVLIAGMVWWFLVVMSQRADTVDGLPPCATEDSTNCYWDADTMGNGEGLSFIDIDGTVYYEGDVPPCTDAIANAGGVCIGEPR